MKLKPCPFCGGPAEIYRNSLPPKLWYPSCAAAIFGNCPGINEAQDEQGGSSCDCSTYDDAVVLWNMRRKPRAQKKARRKSNE